MTRPYGFGRNQAFLNYGEIRCRTSPPLKAVMGTLAEGRRSAFFTPRGGRPLVIVKAMPAPASA